MFFFSLSRSYPAFFAEVEDSIHLQPDVRPAAEAALLDGEVTKLFSSFFTGCHRPCFELNTDSCLDRCKSDRDLVSLSAASRRSYRINKERKGRGYKPLKYPF